MRVEGMTLIDFDDWELSYIATAVKEELDTHKKKNFDDEEDYEEWLKSMKKLFEKVKAWVV